MSSVPPTDSVHSSGANLVSSCASLSPGTVASASPSPGAIESQALPTSILPSFRICSEQPALRSSEFFQIPSGHEEPLRHPYLDNYFLPRPLTPPGVPGSFGAPRALADRPETFANSTGQACFTQSSFGVPGPPGMPTNAILEPVPLNNPSRALHWGTSGSNAMQLPYESRGETFGEPCGQSPPPVMVQSSHSHAQASLAQPEHSSFFPSPLADSTPQPFLNWGRVLFEPADLLINRKFEDDVPSASSSSEGRTNSSSSSRSYSGSPSPSPSPPFSVCDPFVLESLFPSPSFVPSSSLVPSASFVPSTSFVPSDSFATSTPFVPSAPFDPSESCEDDSPLKGVNPATRLRYFCEICGKGHSRQSNLVAHMRDTHSTTKKVFCNFQGCTKAYKRVSECRRHQKDMHGIPLPSELLGKARKPRRTVAGFSPMSRLLQ